MKPFGGVAVAVFGGAGKWEMAQALKNGAEIVIATPGRLIELIRSKATNLQRTTMLVLDEADRMFALGFEYQMRCVLDPRPACASDLNQTDHASPAIYFSNPSLPLSFLSPPGPLSTTFDRTDKPSCSVLLSPTASRVLHGRSSRIRYEFKLALGSQTRM